MLKVIPQTATKKKVFSARSGQGPLCNPVIDKNKNTLWGQYQDYSWILPWHRETTGSKYTHPKHEPLLLGYLPKPHSSQKVWHTSEVHTSLFLHSIPILTHLDLKIR